MAQYTFDTIKDFELAGISLPSGYQRVEWLQSTGTQYIKIPCQLNAIDIIETKYKSAAGWTFGNCANSDGSKGLMLSQQATTAESWFGNSRYQDTLPFNTTNSYAKIVTDEDAANVPSSLNAIGLFCNLYQNNISNRASSTYYHFSTNLFSLVACRRTSDSVAGMYDVVNDVFYTNAGTGTFSIGGDVAPITPISGDTATITDLGITLTSNGTDWYVTNNITIPTLSQATQLFSFAKGNNGVTVTVTSTGGVYKYEVDNWQIWYTIIPPLVFKGFSFEQTDYWQIPESVFRGFSFERENILRYYGVKIDVNGVAERNYIPCIRTSDGIAGLYDTVNGVFYASAGANNFTT